MATPPALRVVEKEWVAWKRLWKASVFQATVSPLLFLARRWGWGWVTS